MKRCALVLTLAMVFSVALAGRPQPQVLDRRSRSASRRRFFRSAERQRPRADRRMGWHGEWRDARDPVGQR